MSVSLAGPPARTDNWRSPGLLYFEQVFGVCAAEVQKLYHDPFELFTRAVQPVIWLLLFGEAMARVHGLVTGGIGYMDFVSAGILTQSVLFVAIFYGIAAIWERDLGILHRYLVSPAPRSALVIGKALSAGIRGLSQAIVVYVLAGLLDVAISLRPLHLALMVAFIIAGAALFATFSLIVACIVKTRERFMGIGQVVTMPLFFASNAIYPLSIMPAWLRTVARLNPLTYEVDAVRALMLKGGASTFGIVTDLVVIVAVFAALVAVAARLYGRMGS